MSSFRKRVLLSACALVVVALGLSALTDGVRWRASIVSMKATGRINDIDWSQLLSMLKPGSGFFLAPLRDTPNPFAVIRNPHSSAADVEAGRQSFLARCSPCHGDVGEGKNAPSLTGRPLRAGDSDWSLFRSITGGFKDLAMPPVAMKQIETWQTVAYVQTLRHISAQPADARNAGHPGPVEVAIERIENAASEPEAWLTYAGDYNSWRFTRLAEITTHNVANLKLWWSLQLDATQPVESSPLVVDGVMYFTAPTSDLLAINAVTGEVYWRYRRPIPNEVPACCGRVNRGVAVLGNRVYLATLDGYLIALDAQHGNVVWETQVADYHEGYSLTLAPLAVHDRLIVGVSGGEYGARGFIAAYAAATGERLWRFYTIPRAGEPGAETWENGSWRNGGGPGWVTGSFDPALNLLYWGTGNPSPDFSGDTRPGDNLFTDSVVALNADDGKLAWHYQFTPHDEHDWDSNQSPVLIDHEIDGELRHLVLWANRNGFYYVLDRVTGKFIRAVPFVKQTWAERIDETGRPVLAPNSAPSRRGTLTWPGVSGGGNWWSPSYSPRTNLFYAPFAERPTVYFKGTAAEPK
ncbi:MAG TPA: PQQ-binding-like beta-propeller repeat protein, partial [Gemmatimonadales bacterium]|nr:PQQ-binding-like beta-propeller repeat protein [Gemmatimonadales bacterium]